MSAASRTSRAALRGIARQQRGGSLLEVCNAGNSNRILGLFTDVPKGLSEGS